MEVLVNHVRQLALSRSLCCACVGNLKKSHTALDPWRGNGSRNFHTSLHLSQNAAEESQALPLSGYYEDLLATPIPRASQTREPPKPPNKHRPKIFYGAERKYRGGISDTPDSTWRTINGVPIPPRPAEPDNCCMGGCVHCVWDDYRDEVEGWAVRLREAQAKAKGQGMKRSPKTEMTRPEVAEASGTMDDDGGGSEGLWDSPMTADAGEDLFQSIPVGIREFMATEKRLRDRKKQRAKSR